MSKGPQLNGKLTGDQEVLTREETLRILSEMTRRGSVSAAIALERALRLGNPDEDGDDVDDELERLLREPIDARS